MGRFRIVFITACLVLAGLVGAFVLTRPGALMGRFAVTPPPGAAATQSAPGGPAGNAAIGGAFQLVDQNGRAVDQRILNGKWSAVFFGYTFCPDACPTTLQALAAVQDQLGPKAKDFQVVFVSVDPARDTSAKLKTYLSTHGFPAGVIGLTGTSEQVARAAQAYRVYYARHGDGPDYLMDHSVATYLMDPGGRFVAVLAPGETPQAVAAQIIKEMQSRA